VFINDILDGCHKLGAHVPGLPLGSDRIAGLLLADDLVLVAPSKRRLQKLLDRVSMWSNKFEMACNHAKCGIMAIGEEVPETSAVAWRLQGGLLPVVDTYKYLGIEFNNKLDLGQICDSRVKSLERAMLASNNFFSNTSIPLAARVHAFKAVIVPIALYGGELLGMMSEHADALQRPLNAALKRLLGVSATSRMAHPLSIMHELDVLPLGSRMAAARVRAYRKLRTVRTWISALIEHPMTAARRTWVSGTKFWLARWGPKRAMVEAELLRKNVEYLPTEAWSKLVKKTTFTRYKNRRAVTASCTWKAYLEAGFSGSASQIMKNFGLNVRWAHRFCTVLRMRTGFFWTGLRAAQAGLIDSKFKSRCPCCGGSAPETIEHYLCDCPEWDEARSVLLESIEANLDTPFLAFWGALLSGGRARLLLGGEVAGRRLPHYGGTRPQWGAKTVGFGVVPTAPVEAMLNFVASTAPRRAQLLWATSTLNRRPHGIW
jgi:hypothetical protein